MQQNDLRILSILYYILSFFFGIIALGSLAYVVLGVAITSDIASENPNSYGFFGGIGMIFVVYFFFIFMFTGLYSVLTFLSARKMRKLENRSLSMVVAGFTCLLFPLGTILGIFTIRVLSRPEVMDLYQSPHFQSGKWEGF